MYWSKLGGLFILSSVKFMFAPLGGPHMGLSFWETYLACVSGAIITASFFYFSANYFMKRARTKREQKYRNHIEKGIPYQHKRVFTRTNKAIVKVKLTLGIYGTALWVPLFLSVPLGNIITAKFYGGDRRTFPTVVFGMCMNGGITTSIAYFIIG